MNIEKLTTESRNPDSEQLDSMSASEIVALMNREDARVTQAVHDASADIAVAIDVIAGAIAAGGRLVYIGAGTSGRLGVLDASECPPTFNTPPEMVVGVIAGGVAALTQSIEGVEDQPATAVADLQAINLTRADVLVGIATSGRTPYVLGGLEYGRQLGAQTIGITCNRNSEIDAVSAHTITLIVGPEIVSGSTRLKAGTATKMVLNMLTTGAMVLLGKTYGNLMVDMRAKNSKLRLRAQRIVATLTGLDAAKAQTYLDACDGDVKTAVVACRQRVTPAEAQQLLIRAKGHLRTALEGSDSHGQE